MQQRNVGLIDRRLAIGSLAAAATLPWARSQVVSRIITQRGVAGGGQVEFAEGTAQFTLFASSMVTTENEVDSDPVFLGRFSWNDETVGYAFTSVRITRYQNLNLEIGEGRRVEGVVTAIRTDAPEEQPEEQPFVLEVRFDPANDEPSRVAFGVGAATAGVEGTPGADALFTYAADGEITVGGVLETDFAVDPDTGTVTEPEVA